LNLAADAIVKLSGNILTNLRGAVQSATRLRGRPVHVDTLDYWRQLLKEARRQARLCETARLPPLETLIEKLSAEVAERSAI
jgi:hypothetical protein